jgi:hypothetical protein
MEGSPSGTIIHFLNNLQHVFPIRSSLHGISVLRTSSQICETPAQCKTLCL